MVGRKRATEEIRQTEELAVIPNGPNRVVFLYVDEKYMDEQSPSKLRVTSLTGLAIAAGTYSLFRNRFFRLLPGFAEEPERFNLEVHASNLFRDLPDEEHFAFYQGLVSLVNELGCRVYRRGLNFNPGHKLLLRAQRTMLWYCFRSLLIAVVKCEDQTQIWPVIEIDHTEVQDRHFAGYIRWMDHTTAYRQMTGDGVKELIDENFMVDNERIGDLHYMSKRSIVGSAVDCLAYLLHCKWLGENSHELSNYKRRIATITSHLDASLVDDHVALYRAN